MVELYLHSPTHLHGLMLKYNAFNDRGNPATALSENNISHVSLL
jgi:hypothetical protein